MCESGIFLIGKSDTVNPFLDGHIPPLTLTRKLKGESPTVALKEVVLQMLLDPYSRHSQPHGHQSEMLEIVVGQHLADHKFLAIAFKVCIYREDYQWF